MTTAVRPHAHTRATSLRCESKGCQSKSQQLCGMTHDAQKFPKHLVSPARALTFSLASNIGLNMRYCRKVTELKTTTSTCHLLPPHSTSHSSLLPAETTPGARLRPLSCSAGQNLLLFQLGGCLDTNALHQSRSDGFGTETPATFCFVVYSLCLLVECLHCSIF